MIPFQLHRRIPLVRRPFYQRDLAIAERNALREAHARLQAERDALAETRAAPLDEPSDRFSLRGLERTNPGLARHFLSGICPSLPHGDSWLHLGCGRRVFDGFANVDLYPQDPRVIRWDLLDSWPEDLVAKLDGVFSEDCLEHFFHGEQTYILCNINRGMKPGAVARILMPKLTFASELTAEYNPPKGEFLSSTYGVETMVDALNYGMRFTGHRWLHDEYSFRRMAERCGFSITPSNRSTTTPAQLDGLNLRDQSDSVSFGSDLTKMRSITRMIVPSALVTGATKVEDLSSGAALFVATAPQPSVAYALPQPISSDLIPCINIRSANLSSFGWALKTLNFGDDGKIWQFDETLKAHPGINIITQSQINLTVGEARPIETLCFTAAASVGEYFTLGGAELHYFEQ